MPLGSVLLEGMCDYLLFYAKDKRQVKYRHLFRASTPSAASRWTNVELNNGERRKLNREEAHNISLLPRGSRVYRLVSQRAPSYTSANTYSFEFKGSIFNPPKGGCWVTSKEKMQSLADLGRLEAEGDNLSYVLYHDDFPYSKINNFWDDTSPAQLKQYVVQTSEGVITRCMLMTTDPGDLVFDSTCGSGTSAYVAETLGRRWMTCDTSRVAVTLAKQRLMTSRFDYFELAHSEEGVSGGFKYKKVPHITMASIVNDEAPKEEVLYDQPQVASSKVRVTGPFTVEAVPALRTKPFDNSEPIVETTGSDLARIGETGKQQQWRDELSATGIRATGGKMINFACVEPMSGTRFLHARGEILEASGETKVALISFGPDFGPLEQRQVEEALKEARSLKEKPAFVIFAAFQFDPEAAKDIEEIEWANVTILKAQMSADLLTADLRKKRASSQSFWLIGQPDVDVLKQKDGTFKVKVNGFDYYNHVTGEVQSGGTDKIAMWFLDTDYDERSLLPEQVFFPNNDPKRDWTRLLATMKKRWKITT